VLLASCLGLALPGGGMADSGPVYEEAPVYQPAPRLPKLRFTGVRLNRGSGTAIVFVRVPGTGRAILHGRGVRRLARFVDQPRQLGLLLRPKVRLMHFLKRHGKGRIRALVTFRPEEGDTTTIERPITLKRRDHG
jgi:hypothetical protein